MTFVPPETQEDFDTRFDTDLKGRHIQDGDRIYIDRVTVTREFAIATGGFGCNPDSHGSAVFVKYDDDKTDRIERHQIHAIEKETENA